MSGGAARPGPRLASELGRLLQRTEVQLTGLSEHLHATRQALLRGDTQHLETYLDHELELLAALEQTSASRRAVLAEHGFGRDQAGMEQALAACGAPEMRALWRALRAQLDDCRQRNRANALLARQASRHAGAALGVLRGEPVAPAGAGYGPRGELREDGARPVRARA